jgi:hypothetical protein
MLNFGYIYTLNLMWKGKGLNVDFKRKYVNMCMDFIPLHGEKW